MRRPLLWFVGVTAAVLASTSVVALVLGAAVVVVGLGTGRGAGAAPSSSVAVRDGVVPSRYRAAFDYALTLCPALPAPVLAAQMEQESGWDPDAVSPAGARGLGQFMPATWREHAVDADGGGADITGPADSLASAAAYDCALLAQLSGRGYDGGDHAGSDSTDDPDVTDLALMLAGYNAGPGAVQRFGGVPPPSFAGGETHDYVASVLARAAEVTVPGVPGLVVAGSVPDEPLPAYPVDAGGLAPNTEFGRRWVDATFGTTTPVSACAASSGHVDGSYHYTGHACDVVVGRLGTRPDAAQLQLGWAVADALVANADGLAVEQVIWQGRIWTADRPTWREYTHPDAADGAAGTSVTLAHLDHVHVSFSRDR